MTRDFALREAEVSGRDLPVDERLKIDRRESFIQLWVLPNLTSIFFEESELVFAAEYRYFLKQRSPSGTLFRPPLRM